MHDYTLSTLQKDTVIHRTHTCIDQINQELSLNLEYIPVLFDLKGRASGMFVVKNGTSYIRYNEIIFSRYFEDSLHSTTAHEVAHYACYAQYARKQIKPHGQEWRYFMSLLNVKAEVTSRYDLDGLPLRQQIRHLYACNCMQHSITTTRHNRIQKNRVIYRCKNCYQPLSLVKSITS